MASALGMSEKTIANSLTNMRALGILRGRCFPLAHEVAYQDGKAERKPFPAWIRNTGLSSGPATLYICLMTHADADTGLAYVTVKELMKDNGMGKATIHRHLRSLEAARYLYRKSGQSEGERNEYLLWKPNATFPDGSLMPVPKHFRGVPHE
jgi:DNA-binding HxlR family transcriptional regulator